MKLTKKMVLASTVALSLLPALTAQADELVWTPRSLDDIKSEVVVKDGTVTYVVKYGDTLSTIAEAMTVDMAILAKVNHIMNVDLIFPETVLTMSYDQNHQPTGLQVESPLAPQAEEKVVASVNLESQEVIVQDQTVSLNDIPVSAVAETVTPAPVVENSADLVQPAPVATPEVAAVVETPVVEPAPVAEQVTPVVEEMPANPVVLPETPAVAEVVETPEASIEITPVAEASLELVTPEAEIQAAPAEVAAAVETPVVASEPALAPEAPAPVAEVVPEVVETPVVEPATPSYMDKEENKNLKPHVAAYKEEVAAMFGVTEFSTYRANDPGDHGKGLAVDFMVPVNSAQGDQIAAYAISNMDANKISYVIWKQQFYSPMNNIYGPANTWNQMEDRGNVTQNHYDHVHVSFHP